MHRRTKQHWIASSKASIVPDLSWADLGMHGWKDPLLMGGPVLKYVPWQGLVRETVL